MTRFAARIAPKADETIIDVGGGWYTWANGSLSRGHVTLINPLTYGVNAEICRRFDLSYASGDARALPYPDRSFAIGFSNSVIEHVGEVDDQQRFASEIRRVAERLWVQTPARGFFIEPHYMTPFIHWLPKSFQRKTLRWITVWGWLQRPDRRYVDKMVDEIRLLDAKEMRALFPDCEIIEERVLFGLLVKSYIAVRS